MSEPLIASLMATGCSVMELAPAAPSMIEKSLAGQRSKCTTVVEEFNLENLIGFRFCCQDGAAAGDGSEVSYGRPF